MSDAPWSGELRKPQSEHDKALFDAGVAAFAEGYMSPPFPGADTWADMMTNQGWVWAYRQSRREVEA